MKYCLFFWHNWQSEHSLHVNPNGMLDGKLATIRHYERCSKCKKTKAHQWKTFYNYNNFSNPEQHKNQINEIRRYYWENYG